MESNRSTPRHHKLFYASSYDRGLDILLFLWPDILKAFPDAELHIAYGWKLFDQFAKNNPERRNWKKQVEMLLSQKGIFHYGRLGKRELDHIRKKCGIWAYPTYFQEINCITALEAQKDGLVPVTMTLGALNETVQSGFKIEGDIKNVLVKDEYLRSLLELMGDRDLWEKESRKAVKWGSKHYWGTIAKNWDEVFKTHVKEPLVSVITITIRPGFWNIMADNLSRQTYKNFEWIIVDDYEKDRSRIAVKYAKKYKLNITYIRGDKVLGKYDRRYGLVRANNTGWKAAKGELTVWLQDFILIPKEGIERLVDVYRHNPNTLIAPTDISYNCIQPNLENKEDWFNGKTDILTNIHWKNVRNTYQGLRPTDIPYDFEMNWGAIPKQILDRLNGWWEFFDSGLGFDNADIAYRAMLSGCDVYIDDTNVAKSVNLWPYIGGKKENIEERERRLAIPQWVWLKVKIEEKQIPLIRDEQLDGKINFDFEIPKDIKDEDASNYIRQNAVKISGKWTL